MTHLLFNSSFSSPRTLKVLVIGDGFIDHPTLPGYFRSLGIDVWSAHDSIEGARFINDWHPDAVLCDAELSDLSAASFCKIVRETTGNESLPFIVLGSDDMYADDIREMFVSGADDFIDLSGNAEILVAKLERLVMRRTRESAKVKVVVHAAYA